MLARRWLLVGLVLFGVFLVGIFLLVFKPGSLSRLMGSEPEGVLTLSVPQTVRLQVPFTVTVAMDTGGKQVNATGVYLFFDKEFFQVQQMDTTMSFCQFYPEKKYDNNTGQVSLACGSPHPGISGEDTLMRLEVTPLKLGESTIRMGKSSQILASDGLGTNILNVYPAATIAVLNSL